MGVVVRIRFKGVVDVEIQDSTPDWSPNNQPVAPKGAPTVLYVILDDVRFSALEPCETPNIKLNADTS
jgi:hypothetical protein